MLLLSTMEPSTSRLVSGLYMTVLGIGLGLTMQVLVLATQNSVRVADLGVATSTVNFFRSVGGSIGVALFGAIFNSRLVTELAGTGVALPDPITPQAISALPDGQHTTVVDGFANALTSVFLIAVPVILVGFLLSLRVKEIPLRSSSGNARALAEQDVAAESAELTVAIAS